MDTAVQEEEFQDSQNDDFEIFELDMIDRTCLQSDQ